MSIEEIISVIEELADGAEERANDYDYVVGVRNTHAKKAEALREAIALLRTHPDEPNEPLTEAEVEEYKGKPLWFERPSLNHCSGGTWEIVDGVNTYDHVIILRGGKIVRGYGLDAVAYRRPPKEET